MAIASLHLCSRNISRMMQPTISLSKISLSPSPLSNSSFSHSPSLWCPTLACASLSNKIKHCRFETRITTIASLDIVGGNNTKGNIGHGMIPRRLGYEKKNDSLRNVVDSRVKKVHERDEESIIGEPPAKAPRIEGQCEGQSFNPASTQQETKDGEKEASGDLSVNVGLEIMEDGEFVLKIKKIIPSSTHENEVERAKQMAQNAALLLIHGEMLQEMGEKLLQQSQTSLRSLLIKKSAPPISEV